MIKKYLMRVERADFFLPFKHPSFNKILIQGIKDKIDHFIIDYNHPHCKINIKRIPWWNRTEDFRHSEELPIFETIEESFFSRQIIFYHRVFLGDRSFKENEKRSFYQRWTGRIRKF